MSNIQISISLDIRDNGDAQSHQQKQDYAAMVTDRIAQCIAYGDTSGTITDSGDAQVGSWSVDGDIPSDWSVPKGFGMRKGGLRS